MCWSGEASTAVATIGFASSIYAVYKGEPKALCIPLFYFSLMEALQAYTYIYINMCHRPENQIATLLGYLHICFQPFFINMASMYFIPDDIRKRVEVPVYTLCFASAIVMLIQLYPFDWAGHCAVGRPLCGPHLCSVSGNWHIAWEVPANGIGNYFLNSGIFSLENGYITYPIVGFFLPVLYGSWRFTVYHLIMGPTLAWLLTSNMNERPAVWCLLSIGFLLLVIKTPLRRVMHVDHYGRWFRKMLFI